MKKQGVRILFGVTFFGILSGLTASAQPTVSSDKTELVLESSKTSSSPIPFPDFKKAVKIAYEYRASLLQHSTGKAQITLKVEYDPEHSAAFPERASEPFVLDPDKREPISRQSHFLVAWYKNEGKRRNDIAFQLVPEQQERALFKKKNIRSAMDLEKSIYYDLDQNSAYLDRSPHHAVNPLNLYNDFEIRYLYTFGNQEIPKLLDDFEKSEMTPVFSEEIVRDVKCIKISFSRIDGKGATRATSLWFAPEQAYALVKGDYQRGYVVNDDEFERIDGRYIESTYVESKDVPGVWVLHTQDYEDASVPGKIEKLHVVISEQKIGVSVSDKIFTFEGMDVPRGIPLYDRRLRGEFSKKIYSETMKVRLDEIGLGQQKTE